MSIPILKLKNLLLTTIQEDLTDQGALQFQTDVLDAAKRQAVDGLVIDITALEVVDSYMARVLNDTANMVRLLGLKAVICGMQPAVALTLVEMGRDLVGVDTALNLELGIERIQQQINEREEA
jgi:rsbT antagonist protein RsbS